MVNLLIREIIYLQQLYNVIFLQYYKPQSALDIPVDLRVTLLPNSANTSGVLRAKGQWSTKLLFLQFLLLILKKLNLLFCKNEW